MRRIRATWSFSSALAVALLCSAAVSLAGRGALGDVEPTPGDVESAKASYGQGMEMREQKDLVGALGRFRAAYALVPTPITGLEVGRTLIDLGHVLEGRALLLEVSRMPKKAGESERAQQARDEAADLADKSRAKLATLTVDTDPSTEPSVVIDDATIPKDAALAPRVVDPGHHVIVIHARGRVGRAEVELAPGETRQVHIEASQDEQPQTVAGGNLRFHPGTPFYVSVVVAGAGALIGIATGIPALTTASSLKSECSTTHVCPQSAAGDLNASLALGWISTVGFAVSGAAIISAVITFAVTGRHEAPAPSPQVLRVQPGLGTLWVTGSF